MIGDTQAMKCKVEAVVHQVKRKYQENYIQNSYVYFITENKEYTVFYKQKLSDKIAWNL